MQLRNTGSPSSSPKFLVAQREVERASWPARAARGPTVAAVGITDSRQAVNKSTSGLGRWKTTCVPRERIPECAKCDCSYPLHDANICTIMLRLGSVRFRA
jgi:hypothetical protein